jgi:hypothetical protein
MVIEYISTETFVAEYLPLRNPFDHSAAFCWGKGHGTMFETYGAELAYVRQQPKRTVWTLISENEVLEIRSGFWRVNRLGFFVTEMPCPESYLIRVLLESG